MIPSFEQTLRHLIAAPSVSSVNAAFDSGNLEVIHLLAEWAEALGFTVEIIPVRESPAKANLIATLGSGEGGLVLAGHTDTVPYDLDRWRHDPFELEERDGRYYGLGSCDMKGFFSLALEAARSFRGQTLKEPLILVATADEESTMLGGQRLLELARPRARYAVIGEPTGLTPIRLHKGIIMEELRLVGQSGHSSDPALGNNAIDGMQIALGTLLGWRKELAERHRNPAFAVPFPTLNLGHICGGDNPNRICGECLLHFDLRLVPGMDIPRLRAEISQRLGEALAHTGLEYHLRSLDVELPPFETPADARLVRWAEEWTGRPAQGVAFATEAPFYQRLGHETLILGPGDIAQAHQPDEYLGRERVAPMLELLRRLIQRVCVEGA